MHLQFENGLQAAADEGEKKKLTQENEALKAQIRKMKIVARTPERSRADERLTSSLKKKALECQDDLEKSEASLAKVRAQLAENAKAKQAKDFKADREDCYDLMAQMEEEMQRLQNQHLYDTQVLEA
ncbi:uncharacterized protein [Nicotiana sylvestris]|uniref:uncharacterized protein n=1 Tax=Nicotiana sylvestris TaxID=4096 RepID=UPI00388CAA83